MKDREEQKASLSQYFDAVDRRIMKLAGGDLHLDLQICGRRLRVHYASLEDMERSRFSFTGMIDDTKGEPEAHLSYWKDDTKNYLPSSASTGNDIYRVRDESGELNILPGYHMKGIDRHGNRYYVCRSENERAPLFGNSHDLLPLFDVWARENGMYIYHGAVVGTGGKGVIIAGRNHAGKSTLAVGCMLQGMDLVTDDQFAAVQEDGVLYAMPIYRILGLNPDSFERLDPHLPVMDTLVPWEEKIFLDISGIKLPGRLAVQAIIVPVLSHEEAPVICPADKGSAIVRIVRSSVAEYRGNDTPETVAGMVGMLKHLPVYEIRLSTDVRANAEKLKRFVQDRLL